MRVLLVDDHQVLRKGLIACLQRDFEESTFGEAGSDRETRLQLKSGWDLILLDLGLPDETGFAVLSHIKQTTPRTKVIVLTTSSEEDCGLQAMNAGADGFLTKTASFSDVSYAIRRVQAGYRYMSESLAAQVLAQIPARTTRLRSSARKLVAAG